jgi:hypothetical protein
MQRYALGTASVRGHNCLRGQIRQGLRRQIVVHCEAPYDVPCRPPESLESERMVGGDGVAHGVNG